MSKPRNIGKKILQLRAKGKTYDDIKNELGCSKATISYWCGSEQREKLKQRAKKLRKTSLVVIIGRRVNTFLNKSSSMSRPTSRLSKERRFLYKIYKFIKRKSMEKQITKKFTSKDVINKFGRFTKCYLTGAAIDLLEPDTYHFDHKIPSSRGGNNSLDNLGICTNTANKAKSNMTPEEFVEFCKKVVKYNS